jgi:tripartite-type tricarboxylate transporter receptor subunit TctC
VKILVGFPPGGTVGAEFVAKSAPDGCTLLMANTGTMVIDPAVYTRLDYQTPKDFAPVARSARQPLALLVTGRERNAALPDVPTFAEAGIKGLEVVGFYGVRAPAGTPKDVVAKLSDALRQTLETPDIRARMVQQGCRPRLPAGRRLCRQPGRADAGVAKAVKDSGTKLD